MKRLGIFSLVLLLVALIAIAMGGYNILQKPLQNQPIKNQTTPNSNVVTPAPATPGTGGQNLSAPIGNTVYSDADRSKKISDQLIAVGNIKRAPVVVNGSKAIVGVQFTDGTTNGINNVIKNLQGQNLSGINVPNVTGIANGMLTGNQGIVSPAAPNTTNTNADIRTLISDKVKKIDSQVTQVFVTTDNGMIDRIQRFVNTTSSEVNDITNKINLGGGGR